MTNNRKNNFASIAVILSIATACSSPAFADSISPSISDIGKVYSTEKADSEYFGTGSTAKLSEASHLRFKADQLLSEGELDSAIKALLKAVQFDPEDPSGHVMLARAMTKKIRASKSNIDWTMYGQCLDEWSLIAKHDADHLEQLEARTAIRSLRKMAKDQALLAKGKTPQKRSFLAGLNPLSKFK